jgi:hypothetical protein
VARQWRGSRDAGKSGNSRFVESAPLEIIARIECRERLSGRQAIIRRFGALVAHTFSQHGHACNIPAIRRYVCSIAAKRSLANHDVEQLQWSVSADHIGRQSAEAV